MQGHQTRHRYFMIGGVPKAATTSVFRYLADHPEVCPANRKESYFFAREFNFGVTYEAGPTLEEFENYFSHCDSRAVVRVEATPYTLYARDAAQTIARLLPEARLLFILRDPVERLLSDYRFHVQRGHPSVRGTFKQFLEYQSRVTGPTPSLVRLGCYIDYLHPFLDTFKDHVSIIFFDELKADTAGALQKICIHAGLDPRFYLNYAFRSHNQTIRVRYGLLNRVGMSLEPVVARLRARAMYSRSAHVAFEKVVDTAKSILFRVNDQGARARIEIPDEAIQELREYYQPYDEALSEALKRQLPWKSRERQVR